MSLNKKKEKKKKSTATAKKNKMTELAIVNLNGSSLMVTSENSDAIRESGNNPVGGFTACKT